MPPDIVVVGGGLGGLFTAALLSREGCRVTVLEKNTIAGGGLQSFRRGALQFDTGMHLLGGFRPGGNVWRLCRHLGVLEKLRLRHTDAQCMDVITLLDEQTTYRIAEGREGFVESWARYFPQARTELQNYVAAMYQLVERLDLFHLRAVESGFFEMPEEFLLTADAFIARYISDERLRELVAYMNPLYGGVKGRTPAYVHAVINVLYIDGPSRFVGESRALADALIEVVEAGGGKVVRGAEVQRIAVHDRAVTHVETTDGRRFSAERYICATHLREMLRLVDAEAFTKAYRTRLASLPVSYSAFCVFVELVPRTRALCQPHGLRHAAAGRHVEHGAGGRRRMAARLPLHDASRRRSRPFCAPAGAHRPHVGHGGRSVGRHAHRTAGSGLRSVEARARRAAFAGLVARASGVGTALSAHLQRVATHHPRLLSFARGVDVRHQRRCPRFHALASAGSHQGAQFIPHRAVRRPARHLRDAPQRRENRRGRVGRRHHFATTLNLVAHGSLRAAARRTHFHPNHGQRRH